MADPFANPLDALLANRLDPWSSLSRRVPRVEPLPPQEEESVLASAGRNVVGGLAYTAQTLDKLLLGRAVRGLLGGKPHELLSAIPGSDVVGLTDPADAVSGEQLLKQSGLLTGEGQKGTFELRDLAGPAAEALLSPGTYLTMGTGAALTGAGRAARAAGALAPTAAGRIAAGQSGLVGLGLPFAQPSAVLGTGPLAQRVAEAGGRALGRLSASLPGRAAGALFDAGAMDTLSPTMQAAARQASAAVPGLEGEELMKLAGLKRQAAAAGLLNDPLVRGVAENAVYGPFADPATEAGLRGVAGGLKDLNRGLATSEHLLGIPTRHVQESVKDVLDFAAGEGQPVGGLKDMGGYVPRSETPLAGATRGYARPEAPLSPWAPHLLPREEILTNIPGVTPATNELLKDPLLRQGSLADAARYAVDRYGVPAGQAERLADFARGLDPRIAEKGLDFFGNSVWTDQEQRVLSSVRMRSKAEALHDALASAATTLPAAGPGARRLADVLKDAKLSLEEAQLYQIEKLTSRGKIAAGLPLDEAHKAFAEMYLPKEVAADATRLVQGYTQPEALKPLVQAIDSITSLFKTGVTAFWPAKYTRDMFQGMFQQWTHNAYDPAFGALNPKGWYAPYKYAHAVLEAGEALPESVTGRIPWLAGLPPAEATAKLADTMHAFGIGRAGAAPGVLENLGRHAAEKAVQLPGSARPSLWEIFKGGWPGKEDVSSWQAFKEGGANPLNVAKVGTGATLTGAGREFTTFKPAVAGGQLMEKIENLNRGAAFIAKSLQGFEPEAAAAASFKAHYNMGNLTGFERSTMRRLVPFYCVPVDHEILTQGGWKTYDQLMVGEQVLSYDHQTEELSWEPLRAVNVFDYDGDLMILERKGGSKFLFTENHRWPIEVGKTFVKGKWYGGERKMVEAKDLNGTHHIPLVGEYKQEESLLSEREASILGWVVTDGYSRWRGAHCEMIVYQSPKKYLQEVTSLLGTTPRKPHPATGVVAIPVALKDAKALTRHFRDKKDLVPIVTHLSRAAAETMYQAMLKAEGWTSEQNCFTHFAQQQAANGKDVTDAFQILCILTGRAANVSGNGCYVRTSKSIRPVGSEGTKPMGRGHYKGKIWCPTTGKGTWVMRHNGAVIITGNSWSRQNLPAVLEEMATKPSGATAMTAKYVASQRDDQGFMPEHLREGLALPVGAGQGGTQRFLSSLGLNFEDLDLLAKRATLGGTVAGSGQHLLGLTNPLVKAPLEVLTNRQFYSGRDLTDLYHSPTGNVLLDQAVMNSPLSRVLTTARTLADERKGLGAKAFNLLGPGKATDVDMERAKSVAAREYVTESLKSNPNARTYEEIYFKPENIPSLSPGDLELYRLYKTLESRAREEGKKRAAAR